MVDDRLQAGPDSNSNPNPNPKESGQTQDLVRKGVDFEALFQILDMPLLILDTDFNIVAANQARTKATGISIEESFGQNVFNVFPDNPHDPKADGVANLKASLCRVLDTKRADRMPVQKYDIPVPQSKNGEFQERYWSPSNLPILDSAGVITHIIHRVEDVTEQVHSQRRETEMGAKLYDVSLFAEELEKSRARAELANETKTAFLANMSHEIRTPLTAVVGFSRLLKDNHLKMSERTQYVDTIIRNGTALTRIIDDILDLAKVEAGKLETELVSFSLYELASDVIDLFKDKTKDKNIFLLLNIDDSVPVRICSDPTRLRQILVNLVGNAVKFTEKGGVRVRIQSTSSTEGESLITIDVKDTGIGLQEEQIEKLFQPFTQADNSMTRKFGGTGLGLALSQRLSRALLGSISISETKVGVGSTFRLTFTAQIPLEKPSLSKIESSARNEFISLKGMRVLVVDDSPDNQFLVTRLLIKAGAEVETAADGEEGLHKALQGSYDVVLMDLQMPIMNGYHAKKSLDERGYNRPVFALTAHAMDEERAKTRAAGFVGHLTKPLVAADLLTALASLPNSQKPRRF